MQVSKLTKENGMTPKAVIRLAAENKLRAFVEGSFVCDEGVIGPYQPVKREVVLGVLLEYDEKLNKKSPEEGSHFGPDDFEFTPPPFGVEIIDSDVDIRLAESFITGFCPADFLLKVDDLKSIEGSDRYSSGQNRNQKLEKDNKILASFLAETIKAILNDETDQFVVNGRFISSRLAKTLEENAINHPNLTNDTGERIKGASESSIIRVLRPVTEALNSILDS